MLLSLTIAVAFLCETPAHCVRLRLLGGSRSTDGGGRERSRFLERLQGRDRIVERNESDENFTLESVERQYMHTTQFETAKTDEGVFMAHVNHSMGLFMNRKPWEIVSMAFLSLWMLLCFYLAFYYQAGKGEPASSFDEIRFRIVVGSDQALHCLGWCNTALARTLAQPVSDPTELIPIHPPWNETSLAYALNEHAPQCNEWNAEAKQDLVKKLSDGQVSSCFRRASCSALVFRMADIVQLVIEYRPRGLVLLESCESQGEACGLLERMPSARRQTHESVVEAAQRTIRAAFRKDWSNMMIINEEIFEDVKTEESAACDESLWTVVRRIFVNVSVEPDGENQLKELGLDCGRFASQGLIYEWSEAAQTIPDILASDQLRHDRMRSGDESNDLSMVRPWSVVNVSEILQKHGVRSCDAHFGVSVDDLVNYLDKGMIGLGVKSGGTELFCFADSVALCASSPDLGTIVEKLSSKRRSRTSKKRTSLTNHGPTCQFPYCLSMHDENVWDTARRVAKGYFGQDCEDAIVVPEAAPEQVDAPSCESALALSHMVRRVFLVKADVTQPEWLPLS